MGVCRLVVRMCRGFGVGVFRCGINEAHALLCRFSLTFCFVVGFSHAGSARRVFCLLPWLITTLLLLLPFLMYPSFARALVPPPLASAVVPVVDVSHRTTSHTQGLRISDAAPFRPISPSHSYGHRGQSPMGVLPSLVGSPPRREGRRTLSYGGNTNTARGGVGGGGVTPSSPGYFLGGLQHGGGGSSSSRSASGGGDISAPGPLHLSSPWSAAQQQGYARSAGAPAPAAFSSSPGILQHESGGEMGGVGASSVSPPGPGAMSRGLSAGGGGGGGGGVESAKIVDFSPTWDFAPGGAKLLICLAAPVDFEVGMQGPIVYFADRPVQVSNHLFFISFVAFVGLTVWI